MTDKERLPDFSDKCVVLWLTTDDKNYDLDKPFFEYQGGSLFLIGRTPRGVTASNWNEGKLQAVRWDLVETYVLFDTVEEWNQATSKALTEKGR